MTTSSRHAAQFSATLMKLVGHTRRTKLFVAAPNKLWRRTRAADRTRTKRWRAGTRRARRQIAAAKKLGLPHPFAPAHHDRPGDVLIVDEAYRYPPRTV